MEKNEEVAADVRRRKFGVSKLRLVTSAATKVGLIS
jgi:hypothetical protein